MENEQKGAVCRPAVKGALSELTMIINGDCKEVLKTLESNSINCCVTSPPYYGLRDYGVEGQIGLEDTPQEYIDKLVIVFQEVKRVLKSDGTLWINIADSYAGSGKGAAFYPKTVKGTKQATNQGSVDTKIIKTDKLEGYKPKDLIGIPWMLAFALRDDGWYLRQDIIWHKSNPMPESVKDRCTKAHEYIFLLSKSRQYYYDHEAIKEPCVGFNNEPPAGSLGTLRPNARCRKGNNKTFRGGGAYTNNQSFNNHTDAKNISVGNKSNETGLKNKRSVWTVGTKGYKGAHFATFPPDLIKPCILAGCPENGTVLDPFSGSGTTGEVAEQNGRKYAGIELNPQYCELSKNRLKIE